MLNIGVVGCGDIAVKSYLPSITGELADICRLTAVCDIEGRRAQAAQEKFGAKHAFTDYAQFLRNGEMQAVVVLTPLLTHAKFAAEAIAAGRHVFTEKPVAASVKEADALVAAAAGQKMVLASAPYPPVTPLIREARRLVEGGAIGKVCLARSHSSHGGPELGSWKTDPSWVYRKSVSGPVPPIFDMGVYGISTLAAILGPVKRLTAFSGLGIRERRIEFVEEKGFKPYTHVPDCDDNSFILLDFGEGRFAALDASFCLRVSEGPQHELFGSQGAMFLFPWQNKLRVQSWTGECGLPAHDWVERTVEPKKGGNFIQGLVHFLQCIGSGEKPVNGGEFSRHLVEIMEAAIASAQAGGISAKLSTTFERPKERK